LTKISRIQLYLFRKCSTLISLKINKKRNAYSFSQWVSVLGRENNFWLRLRSVHGNNTWTWIGAQKIRQLRILHKTNRNSRWNNDLVTLNIERACKDSPKRFLKTCFDLRKIMFDFWSWKKWPISDTDRYKAWLKEHHPQKSAEFSLWVWLKF